MSVHVEWDNAGATAILWTFDGRWTWGEFDEAVKSVGQMFETVDHPVDFIVDVRQMSILPPDVVSRVKQKYLTKCRRKSGAFSRSAWMIICACSGIPSPIYPMPRI